jgi:hypothetical protein
LSRKQEIHGYEMAQMKTKTPVHLLLRFSDSLLKDGDTITKHNKVIARDGAVWFANMGSSVAQRHIDVFNEQIQEENPIYVYLVKGNDRKSWLASPPKLMKY